MANFLSELIRKLTGQILEIAQRSRNEEELRINFVSVLREFVDRADWQVPLSGRHEKTLVSGRADSVFGQVIIEYKHPDRSLKTAHTLTFREAEEELKRYITSEAGEDPQARKRYVGVGLNGHNIFFLRWRGPDIEDWRVEGPFEVTENSIGQFVHYLRALARKRLSSEALSDSFGPQSVAARSMVNALLKAFTASDHPKIQTMYQEWDRIFGIVYGQDLSKAIKDAQELVETYQLDTEADLKPLLFCVHTYFALFIKLLTAELICQQDRVMPSFIADLPAASPKQLQRRLTELEEGGIFTHLGIYNFLEGNFFGWFLETYTERLDRALRVMLREMQTFEPATPTFAPEHTRDLLKHLYQYLVPKKLRHDLGEYYTPDWLAELVLNEVGYEGNPTERILDPACGSGTFLVLVIRRIREYADEHLLERKQLVQDILANVVGFDLNPLAVIAARANYLLALGDLINELRPIRLPVYLCDSILTPSQEAEQQQLLEKGLRLRTVVGNFDLPAAVIDEGRLDALTACLEACVRDNYSAEEFLARVEDECGLSEEGFAGARSMLRELYEKLADLQVQGRNRIWARLIKNAFAPLFQPKFDFVVGNPPWVNWESLSDEYRTATKQLWVDYGLFSLSGHAARLGGGKKDFAMLFAYACTDNYLKEGGSLGFVITQTVFKTKGAGDGFRRFRLGPKGPLLSVQGVHDLVEIQPFEGASNRTAIFCWQPGAETEYPVPYALWRKTQPGRVREEATLTQVKEQTGRVALAAQPIDKTKKTSPWLTARPQAVSALEHCLGKSAYEAHAGSYSGGANGVYWLEILQAVPDGNLLVRNLHDIGRKEIPEVTAAMEPDLIYPLLRGRDVNRWQAAPSLYVLVAQDPETRVGWDEKLMKHKWPKTYSYLLQFKDILLERASSSVPKDPFYSMYAVSTYTFASWKMVWRSIGDRMLAAVVSSVEDEYIGSRVVVPDINVMMVPFEESAEAHYLCALLNSAPADLVVRSYTVSTRISTHVLDNVAIPKFNPEDATHQRLAELSQQTHQLAAAISGGTGVSPVGKDHKEGRPRRPPHQEEERLAQIEEEIDKVAAKLWGLSDKELAVIKQTLKDLS